MLRLCEAPTSLHPSQRGTLHVHKKSLCYHTQERPLSPLQPEFILRRFCVKGRGLLHSTTPRLASSLRPCGSAAKPPCRLPCRRQSCAPAAAVPVSGKACPHGMAWRHQILPYAGSLAAVALIEQLMTLELVNVMTKTGSNTHRGSFGLGVGNVVAGCFGGMGGNAMIGQSVIQVRCGGTHRLSNIIVGVS